MTAATGPSAGQGERRSPELSRSVPLGRRLWYAYAVTLRVVASYAWLVVQGRMLGPQAMESVTLATHMRNARRIADAIARLQGLFIKVGQLISIMTNFLP